MQKICKISANVICLEISITWWVALNKVRITEAYNVYAMFLSWVKWGCRAKASIYQTKALGSCKRTLDFKECIGVVAPWNQQEQRVCIIHAYGSLPIVDTLCMHSFCVAHKSRFFIKKQQKPCEIYRSWAKNANLAHFYRKKTYFFLVFLALIVHS